MILFKILQQFLLPSVFILVLILAGLIFLWSSMNLKFISPSKFKKEKTGKALIIVGLLLYYLFSTTAVSNFLLSPLESKYFFLEVEEMEKADKVVLLLGGKEADVLRGSEVLRLWQELGIKNKELRIIISGTDPINPEINEAEQVKEFLRERGILPENIILEDKSRNTFESAKNIKEMLDNEPFFLVTSAYHMPRAMEIFQKMGNKPIPAPSDFKIKKDYDILDFLPNAENLRNSDLVFHEYFGILWYRLKY